MSEREIFMVYRKGGDMPLEVHDNFNEAMTEAQRLANLPVSIKNGATFHVMQAINVIKSPEPVVIEVGDEISLNQDTHFFKKGAFCDVIEVCPDEMPIGRIKVRASIEFYLGSDQYTLIRKGNVHTFEGVMIGHYNQPAQYMTLKFKEDMGLSHKEIMKTYKMTLEEENDGN